MRRFIRVFCLALLLVVLPMKHFAQQPRLIKVSEFSISNIRAIEDRVFMVHAITEKGYFCFKNPDIPNTIDVYVKDDADDELSDFDFFYDNLLYDQLDEFSLLDKATRGNLFVQWRQTLDDEVYKVLYEDFTKGLRSENATCETSLPFCTNNGLYNFPAGVDAGSPCGGTCSDPYHCSGAHQGQDNCLSTAPNPAFYYMRIDEPGNLNIHMYSTPSHDIDFDCWGPFDDINTACDQLSCSNMVDCCYSTASTENCHINNAQTGQYYVLLITNFSNQPCNINFENTGTGTTDCSILPPLVDNDGPYCLGETIHLSAVGQSGATYSWTGPNGFTSTQQNPIITNCTLAMSGTYTCTITLGGESATATTSIIVLGLPTASFEAATVCVGNPTAFHSTSVATGQHLSQYTWTFGDGTTGEGEDISHNYNEPGSYQVTHTVSTSNGCTDEITQTITVNPQPAISFEATTVCQGQTTEFTSASTGDEISSYQWDFGDGQTGDEESPEHTYNEAGTYQVTVVVQSEGGCTDQFTQDVIVNPQPVSSFNATSVCQGTPTLFTSTATGEQINVYQWNFGDGQIGNGESISHTYAEPGSYQATLTVQAAGGCSDEITQAVDVYAMPVASATATPSTILYGATTTLSANAGATGTFNFHWEPADMVANPNGQTTQTVALQESQTYTVTVTNPQGDCVSTAQVIVSIDGSSLLAMATADKNDLCDGEATTLHAIPSGGAPENYTFQWSPAESLNNATSQNPVATPELGNTTYSCHVSDGFTDIDVSVTIHVHPNVEKDIYQTICENDVYSYFGEDIHTPGVYDHTLNTQYGCDSIVHLHLDNWQIYETPISDRFCEDDTYDFFDQSVTEAGVYYHTLSSIHGCDSTIKLNLIQDPIYEFEMWESTCEGGPGFNYNGEFLPPRDEPYVYHYPTVKQCDSTIIIHIEESAYNSKSYNVSLCGTEFTWGSNGITYYETGVYYDTLQFDNSCDSTIVLNLVLRPNYSDEVVATSCDSYHWVDDNFNVDMTFTESTDYTHQYINTYGCESEATLHLTINNHDEIAFTVPEEEACDEYFWDPKGHTIVYSDHTGDFYDMTGVYHRTYKNISDCDSLVTMSVQMEYTPHPTPIYPMDLDNTAPHWVVTATEFQINTYDFNLWDTNPNCHWDSVTWSLQHADNLNWFLEPFGDKNKSCKVYVLSHVNDTIWLTAHAFNRCAPDEGIEQRYWLVCSFYGIDEQESPADFSVVPNPNRGQMTINFENLTGKIKVRVYDMRGVLIDDFETYNAMNSYAYTYQMKNRVAGIYFIVATTKEGTIAKKVVIEK